jgi:hypothetical protein
MRLAPFAAGVNLIADVAASQPLRVDGATPRALQGGSLAKSLTDSALLRATYKSLILYGRAAWLTRRSASGVGDDVWQVDLGWLERVDGPEWSTDAAGWRLRAKTAVGDKLIVFDGARRGALADGADVIAAAAALEATAARHARTPTPSVVLEADGLDLTDAQAAEVIAKWETGRRAHSTAYLDARIKARTMTWSSAELQLVEARQASTLHIAQLLGLDPAWLGSAAQSLTYQNRQDLNTSLIDLTVAPYLRVVEQTLSNAWQRRVIADTTGFTGAALSARVDALTALVSSGIMSTDEARTVEPLIRDATSTIGQDTL